MEMAYFTICTEPRFKKRGCDAVCLLVHILQVQGLNSEIILGSIKTGKMNSESILVLTLFIGFTLSRYRGFRKGFAI